MAGGLETETDVAVTGLSEATQLGSYIVIGTVRK